MADQPQAPADGHQQMAARIHGVFATGQGVQVSSAQAEAVVEMKLWLAAIANGQLKIIDTATLQPVPKGEGEGDGAPPN